MTLLTTPKTEKKKKQQRPQEDKNNVALQGTNPDTSASLLLGDPGPRRALLMLALLTATLLVSFANKAFNIDDPLFLKAARQIAVHPRDPYGFSVNWYGTEMPMHEVTKNPPLASYAIAAMAAVFGWSEIALHLAFIPFAIAVILGTYTLARRCAAPPVFAALACLLSPIFLVSSTTVMCDTMMLALFIWSIVLWMDGINQRSSVRLLSAGALAGLAVLTKYFAMSLLPLMLAYAIMRRRIVVAPFLAIAIPLVIIIGYQFWTASLYGHDLISDAIVYASGSPDNSQAWAKSLIGPGFVGAVLPVIFFYASRVYSRSMLVIGAILALIAAPLVVWSVAPTGAPPVSENRLLLTVELALLIASGLMIVYLGIIAFRPGADPESMLLGLWVLGTIIFGCFINWTINARSLMPLGPPAAVLLAKKIGARGAPFTRWTAISLIAAAVLSLSVCWGDYRLSESAREAATHVMSLPRTEGKTVWFEGHWGFQHYMEERGAKPCDYRSPKVKSNDLFVIPSNNTNTVELNAKSIASTLRIEIPASRWVSTLCPEIGAGFYAHDAGPLPFVFGRVPLERYDVIRIR